ncbi:MAG: nitrous oxide-stimulated promoter family protein [Sphingobacteriia bacterium]|nr:nitrous oxide-stimulated promoter family protein [Sphingobacteriia bacterium]NCC41204.1 nitrous oxide-stimulated promoter family protein [Gammaproteobacteria bacterium]
MAQGRRIRREQKTIGAMLAIYCRDHHADRAPAGAQPSQSGLCPDCAALLDYARRRLDSCPFQEDKPACNHCQVHCYSAKMRERVREVMRYAGPRMLRPHPILSLWHLIDARRPSRSLTPAKRVGVGPTEQGSEQESSDQ